MKVRILHRLVQEIPADKWPLQLALEKKSDEVESKHGHPTPRRYRAMYGKENANIRVHQREYESFADYAKRFEEFGDNIELQAMEVERRNYFTWEREELYIVDDPNEPIMPWLKMISLDPNSTERNLVVNPDWEDLGL